MSGGRGGVGGGVMGCGFEGGSGITVWFEEGSV